MVVIVKQLAYLGKVLLFSRDEFRVSALSKPQRRKKMSSVLWLVHQELPAQATLQQPRCQKRKAGHYGPCIQPITEQPYPHNLPKRNRRKSTWDLELRKQPRQRQIDKPTVTMRTYEDSFSGARIYPGKVRIDDLCKYAICEPKRTIFLPLPRVKR